MKTGQGLIFETFRFVFGLLLFLLLCLTLAELAVPRALGLGSFFAQVELVLETGGFARLRAGPEPGKVVVGARREDVSQRVPVEGPDGGFVSVWDAVGRVDRLGGDGARVGRSVRRDRGRGYSCGCVGFGQEVRVERTLVAARADEAGVDGVPRDAGHALFVAPEDGDVAHHAKVKNARLSVSTGRGEELVADTAEDRRGEGVLVAVEGGQAARRARVPQPHAVVLAPGHDEGLGRVPVARFHVPAVVLEDGFDGGRGEVPDLAGVVVGCGHELGVAGGERDVADGSVVALELMRVVERGLEVVDGPFVVGGDQPVFAVGPFRRAE